MSQNGSSWVVGAAHIYGDDVSGVTSSIKGGTEHVRDPQAVVRTQLDNVYKAFNMVPGTLASKSHDVSFTPGRTRPPFGYPPGSGARIRLIP